MPNGIGIWYADTSAEKTAAENAREMRDVAIAKRIGEHLELVYPGHWPRVEVDSSQGIARLYHPLLPPTWGYTIHLGTLYSDPGMKCVTRGFGELLERFHQPRGPTTRDRMRQAMKDYAQISRGIFGVEMNIKTGQLRRVMPPELVR